MDATRSADGLRQLRVALAASLREDNIRKERARQSNPDGGLLAFIRYFWHIIEPGRQLIDGWTLEVLCGHLEAITRGDMIGDRVLTRLLANVPPGFMKSLTLNVFWPAWEWGPMGLSHLRYMAFSYAAYLTERDNERFRDLVRSFEYRELWSHVFTLTGDGKVRVTNDKMGFKFATSIGGVGTGERADRVLLDDPHHVHQAESDTIRDNTVRWFEESMSNRLNSLRDSAIVVIMQRVHEQDVSGAIMTGHASEYCHLIIPMEYEEDRHFSHLPGYADPRTRDGELAWPERFGAEELANFKKRSYLWSGQYQQNPVPRGGGLFKQDWWQVHQVVPKEKTLPNGRTVFTGYKFVPEVMPLFVLASLDTAFSEKEENDFSALTVWVVHDNFQTKQRNILLADAWQKRLPHLHGEVVERDPGESDASYRRRSMAKWGLVEWVADTCKRRGVHRLIIENKNRGPDVVREIKRLYADQDWSVQAIDIRGDKYSRAHAIVDLFTDDMIHAPAMIHDNGIVEFLDWAEEAREEIAKFPRGAHDDLLDSMSLALKNLRDTGWAIRKDERRASELASMKDNRGTKRESIYQV